MVCAPLQMIWGCPLDAMPGILSWLLEVPLWGAVYLFVSSIAGSELWED